VFDTDHVPTREERELREDALEQQQVLDEDEAAADGSGRATDPTSRPYGSSSSNQNTSAVPSDDSEMRWWTREELAAHLQASNSIRPNTGIADDEERTAFEVRKSLMDVIFKDPNTNEPVVWKSVQHAGFGQQVTAECTVSYELEAYSDGNDEPFDSTKIVDRLYHSNLTNDPLVPGLFIALTSMKVGEKSQFIIDQSFGFGPIGCPPRIPPAVDLFYDIEVRKVLAEGTIQDFIHKSIEQQQLLPFQKLLDMADSERKSGNAYFTDGRKKPAGIR
jgi:FKBP-type peptidyl-prolyl cis-trans isomerase